MTARLVWKRRKTLRRIEKQARETADPLELLRYVQNRMGSWGPSGRFGGLLATSIGAVIAAAIGAALLVWRIR